ncbi:MAG: hypothetical protein WC943_11040, partial [Elusimicrobiota bacterium]
MKLRRSTMFLYLVLACVPGLGAAEDARMSRAVAEAIGLFDKNLDQSFAERDLWAPTDLDGMDEKFQKTGIAKLGLQERWNAVLVKAGKLDKFREVLAKAPDAETVAKEASELCKPMAVPEAGCPGLVEGYVLAWRAAQAQGLDLDKETGLFIKDGAALDQKAWVEAVLEPREGLAAAGVSAGQRTRQAQGAITAPGTFFDGAGAGRELEEAPERNAASAAGVPPDSKALPGSPGPTPSFRPRGEESPNGRDGSVLTGWKPPEPPSRPGPRIAASAAAMAVAATPLKFAAAGMSAVQGREARSLDAAAKAGAWMRSHRNELSSLTPGGALGFDETLAGHVQALSAEGEARQKGLAVSLDRMRSFMDLSPTHGLERLLGDELTALLATGDPASARQAPVLAKALASAYRSDPGYLEAREALDGYRGFIRDRLEDLPNGTTFLPSELGLDSTSDLVKGVRGGWSGVTSTGKDGVERFFSEDGRYVEEVVALPGGERRVVATLTGPDGIEQTVLDGEGKALERFLFRPEPDGLYRMESLSQPWPQQVGRFANGRFQPLFLRQEDGSTVEEGLEACPLRFARVQKDAAGSKTRYMVDLSALRALPDRGAASILLEEACAAASKAGFKPEPERIRRLLETGAAGVSFLADGAMTADLPVGAPGGPALTVLFKEGTPAQAVLAGADAVRGLEPGQRRALLAKLSRTATDTFRPGPGARPGTIKSRVESLAAFLEEHFSQEPKGETSMVFFPDGGLRIDERGGAGSRIYQTLARFDRIWSMDEAEAKAAAFGAPVEGLSVSVRAVGNAEQADSPEIPFLRDRQHIGAGAVERLRTRVSSTLDKPAEQGIGAFGLGVLPGLRTLATEARRLLPGGDDTPHEYYSRELGYQVEKISEITRSVRSPDGRTEEDALRRSISTEYDGFGAADALRLGGRGSAKVLTTAGWVMSPVLAPIGKAADAAVNATAALAYLSLSDGPGNGLLTGLATLRGIDPEKARQASRILAKTNLLTAGENLAATAEAVQNPLAAYGLTSPMAQQRAQAMAVLHRWAGTDPMYAIQNTENLFESPAAAAIAGASIDIAKSMVSATGTTRLMASAKGAGEASNWAAAAFGMVSAASGHGQRFLAYDDLIASAEELRTTEARAGIIGRESDPAYRASSDQYYKNMRTALAETGDIVKDLAEWRQAQVNMEEARRLKAERERLAGSSPQGDGPLPGKAAKSGPDTEQGPPSPGAAPRVTSDDYIQAALAAKAMAAGAPLPQLTEAQEGLLRTALESTRDAGQDVPDAAFKSLYGQGELYFQIETMAALPQPARSAPEPLPTVQPSATAKHTADSLGLYPVLTKLTGEQTAWKFGEPFFEDAEAALHQGDYQGAAAALDKALGLYQRNPKTAPSDPSLIRSLEGIKATLAAETQNEADFTDFRQKLSAAQAGLAQVQKEMSDMGVPLGRPRDVVAFVEALPPDQMQRYGGLMRRSIIAEIALDGVVQELSGTHLAPPDFDPASPGFSLRKAQVDLSFTLLKEAVSSALEASDLVEERYHGGKVGQAKERSGGKPSGAGDALDRRKAERAGTAPEGFGLIGAGRVREQELGDCGIQSMFNLPLVQEALGKRMDYPTFLAAVEEFLDKDRGYKNAARDGTFPELRKAVLEDLGFSVAFHKPADADSLTHIIKDAPGGAVLCDLSNTAHVVTITGYEGSGDARVFHTVDSHGARVDYTFDVLRNVMDFGVEAVARAPAKPGPAAPGSTTDGFLLRYTKNSLDASVQAAQSKTPYALPPQSLVPMDALSSPDSSDDPSAMALLSKELGTRARLLKGRQGPAQAGGSGPFDGLPEGVVVKDADGNAYVNRHLLRTLTAGLHAELLAPGEARPASWPKPEPPVVRMGGAEAAGRSAPVSSGEALLSAYGGLQKALAAARTLEARLTSLSADPSSPEYGRAEADLMAAHAHLAQAQESFDAVNASRRGHGQDRGKGRGTRERSVAMRDPARTVLSEVQGDTIVETMPVARDLAALASAPDPALARASAARSIADRIMLDSIR